jgi:hypothetical protein
LFGFNVNLAKTLCRTTVTDVFDTGQERLFVRYSWGRSGHCQQKAPKIGGFKRHTTY